jgi:hypothetical protein
MWLLMKQLSLSFFMTIFSIIVNAGGMTSSGADQKSMSAGAAWFLGNDPVEYCIEIAEQQSVNEAKVDEAFHFAIETWRAYMSENTSFPLSEEKPSLNFNKVHCKNNPPLKIYIGVINSEIEKAKVLFEKPYAMAHRISYDMKTRKGTGFIWFAPDAEKTENFPKWNSPYNLQGMMLHEFGHVIGCEHSKNTIMDDELLSKFQMANSEDKNWATFGKFYLSRIDHHQFLHSHSGKKFSLKGEINAYDVKESERLFELLVGRKAKGKIIASAVRDSAPLTYKLKDDIGETEFEIFLPIPNTSQFSKSLNLFKVAYQKSENEAIATSVSPYGTSTLTTIAAKSGQRFSIQVNFNVDSLGWPVTIKIQEPGSPLMKSLFSSDLWMTAGLI